MPDWNVINLLLTAAGSSLTLLIVQLSGMVQNQVNARSSSRQDAEDHTGVMGALDELVKEQREAMGMFRPVVARLNAILDLFERNFMPAPPVAPVAPIAPVAPVAASPEPFLTGRVVDPDPLPPMADVVAPTPSRELQVVSQQASKLSTYLADHQVNASTIIDTSDLERKAKELWHTTAFGSTARRLNARERTLVQQVIADWPTLHHILRDAITQNAILVLPRVLGVRSDDEEIFHQGLQRTVDAYNERCEAGSAAPAPDSGSSRPRRAQPLRIGSQALASGLAWTNESVAAMQRLLYLMPTICLQVDLRMPDGTAHLTAWYWTTNDRQAMSFSQLIRPVAPSPISPRDQDFATGQMLVLLLADLLSLAAGEGASVLSDLLTHQGVSERLQQCFRDWYIAMRAAFALNYAPEDVAGVPEVEAVAEVVNGPPAILLASLRACVAPFNFSASIKGYTDGAYFYLAMQDNRAIKAHVYYLVIEQRPDQRVAIRVVREVLGPTQLDMADVDQRLNTAAAQCQSVYSRSPERFTLIADAQLTTLITYLGANLRKLSEDASAG